MKIEFEDKNLKELFEQGKALTNPKKYRFSKAIIKQYIKGINTLKSAPNIEFLYKIKSLNYEKLSNNRKGEESIRVNDKYRIIFISKPHDKDETITICNITELSNHYQ